MGISKSSILNENIRQSLVPQTVAALDVAVAKWAGDEARNQIYRLGLGDSFKQLEEMNTNWDDNHEALSKLRDEIWEKLGRALPYNENDMKRRQDFVYNMRVEVEYALQAVAKAAIEEKLGKIDPFDDSKRNEYYYGDEKKNLFWLQHILVHIRTDRFGKHGIKSGGGHFDSSPSKSSFHDHHYYTNEFNPATDIGAGIVIFSTSETQYGVARSAVLDPIHEQLFGEPKEGNVFRNKWYREIIPVFLHELTHLEQDSRAQMDNRSYRRNGITYTPDPSRKPKRGSTEATSWWENDPRGSDRKNSHPKFRVFRPGTRGNPDHLSDEDYSNEARMTDYYGTAHEIEAHAVSMASKIMADYALDDRQSRWGYQQLSPNDKARRVNEFVHTAIDDLKNGWATGHTFDRYKTLFKDYIESSADSRSKVDIGRRKVWRIFLTKVIKNLESYLTEVPAHEWDAPKDSGFKRLPTNKPATENRGQ